MNYAAKLNAKAKDAAIKDFVASVKQAFWSMLPVILIALAFAVPISAIYYASQFNKETHHADR
jgi:hypothetical protein